MTDDLDAGLASQRLPLASGTFQGDPLMKRLDCSLLFSIPLAGVAAGRPAVQPVIDMHLHAYPMDELPPGTPACPGDQQVLIPTIDPGEALDFAKFMTCDKPILAAADNAGLRDGTIAALRRHHVRRAMTEGPVELVADWRKAAPDVILPGVAFGKRKEKSIAELRRLHAAGQLSVLGEVSIQYRGHRPDDPRYAPYFALAE